MSTRPITRLRNEILRLVCARNNPHIDAAGVLHDDQRCRRVKGRGIETLDPCKLPHPATKLGVCDCLYPQGGMMTLQEVLPTLHRAYLLTHYARDGDARPTLALHDSNSLDGHVRHLRTLLDDRFSFKPLTAADLLEQAFTAARLRPDLPSVAVTHYPFRERRDTDVRTTTSAHTALQILMSPSPEDCPLRLINEPVAQLAEAAGLQVHRFDGPVTALHRELLSTAWTRSRYEQRSLDTCVQIVAAATA